MSPSTAALATLAAITTGRLNWLRPSMLCTALSAGFAFCQTHQSQSSQGPWAGAGFADLN
jgi:hypothetical protein